MAIGEIVKQAMVNNVDKIPSTFQIKYQRLKQIKQELEKNNFYSILNKRNNTKWRAVLNSSFEINWQNVKRDEYSEQNFLNLTIEAYHLTTDILSQLGLIHSIKTTVTFIDETFNYLRLSDFQLEAQYTRLDKKAESKGGDYAIKLKASKVKPLLEKLSDAEKEMQKAMANHFKNFIQPMIEYQNSNNTGWKVNKGVLAEMYERHIEIGHDNLASFLSDDFPSVGNRWLLYKQSSGSDPYFTGPDTMYSQVKNINASIISDVRTIINTVNGILIIFDQVGNLKVTKDKIEKIFNQSKFIPTMEDSFLRDLINQQPELLANYLAQGVQNIRITTPKGNKQSKRTYKLVKQPDGTVILKGWI